MRFFTRDWCIGQLDDDALERVVPAYWKHFEQIADLLPATLRDFGRHVSIHDGLFRRVILDRSSGTLALHLRCGDLQVGYFDLDITYHDVSVSTTQVGDLAGIVRDRQSEILYDEIDVLERGRFEHRMIFWPRGELWIACGGFSYTRADAPARDIPLDERRLVLLG